MQPVILSPVLIKAARVFSGLNQKQLAELVGVSQGVIKQLEINQNHKTSAQTMAAIQKVFADNHITFDEDENGFAIFYRPPKK